MTLQTKRWMKRELEQLLAQRSCYLNAEAASSDVRQKVRHTTQRLRLDQEILGRREALVGLGECHDEPGAVALERGLAGSPRLDARVVSPLTVAVARATAVQPSPRTPSALPRLMMVCAATFVVGFAGVGMTMSMLDAQPPAMARKAPVAPAVVDDAPRPGSRFEEQPVMAAGARTSWVRPSKR